MTCLRATCPYLNTSHQTLSSLAILGPATQARTPLRLAFPLASPSLFSSDMSPSRTDARGQATAYKPQKNARIPQKSMQRMPAHHQDITLTLLANTKHSQRALAASQAKKALEKAMMFSTPEPIEAAPGKAHGGPRAMRASMHNAMIAPMPLTDPKSALGPAATAATPAITAAAGPATTANDVIDNPLPSTTINSTPGNAIPTDITPGEMTVTPPPSHLSKVIQEQSKTVNERPNPPLWAKAVLVACTAPLVLPALGLVGAYVTGRVVEGTVRAFWGPTHPVC